MPEVSEHLANLLTAERMLGLAKAFAILFIAIAVSRFGSRAILRFASRRGDPQQAQLLARLAAWLLFGLGFAWALQQLGFQLGVLLGAAGVLSVAIGFASQTTLSNLISGIFLFGERPFRLGDWIEVDGISGEVLSVDLMATKLRTGENHFVRIPNELLIKAKVKNQTRFPIRRLDLRVPLPADEDLDLVREVLLELASTNAHCLDEPAPLFYVNEFGDGRVVVQFSVWSSGAAQMQLRTTLTLEMQRAFRERGLRRFGAPLPAPGTVS